jgi:hypothetical protein
MHCAKHVSTKQNAQNGRYDFFYQPIETLKTGVASDL